MTYTLFYVLIGVLGFCTVAFGLATTVTAVNTFRNNRAATAFRLLEDNLRQTDDGGMPSYESFPPYRDGPGFFVFSRQSSQRRRGGTTTAARTERRSIIKNLGEGRLVDGAAGVETGTIEERRVSDSDILVEDGTEAREGFESVDIENEDNMTEV